MGVAKNTTVEAETCLGKQPKGRGGIVLRNGKRGVEPEMIGGWNGAGSGLGLAGGGEGDKGGAIDGQRKRFAGFCRAGAEFFVVVENGRCGPAEPQGIGN